MSDHDHQRLRTHVRDTYGNIAAESEGCATGCCGGTPPEIAGERLGYSAEELAAAPEGANLGLGCGNPQAIAALKEGETVLDLGSGAGFDCFLAARAVGRQGRVIGVDMTTQMLEKARANAAKADVDNLDFRLGEIEALPVADDSVDVIISNCVINLSPDKGRVFREAFRVLRPGGRLAVSDVVATAELPEEVRSDLALHSGCMAGASLIDELEAALHSAGFDEIRITPKDESREFIRDWAPGRGVEAYVVSANIEAVKPRGHTAQESDDKPPLHAAIVSMVSLAAGIASKHPDMGLCQLDRLRGMGVPPHQVDAVVEIARHIRDEAGRKLDAAFDEAASRPASKPEAPKGKPLDIKVSEDDGACCSPTPGGQSCC